MYITRKWFMFSVLLVEEFACRRYKRCWNLFVSREGKRSHYFSIQWEKWLEWYSFSQAASFLHIRLNASTFFFCLCLRNYVLLACSWSCDQTIDPLVMLSKILLELSYTRIFLGYFYSLLYIRSVMIFESWCPINDRLSVYNFCSSDSLLDPDNWDVVFLRNVGLSPNYRH